MNVQKIIEALKDKTKKFAELSSLDSNEKNMVIALSYLLDVTYLFYKKAKINIYIDNANKIKSLDDKIAVVSDMLNKFLNQNYQAKEFIILNEITFSDSSLFISTLLENMYFNDYEHDENLLNIYYYLFHLIYDILSIIVNDKEINRFKEDIIKNYIYHIIQFFVKDKKNPEYNFFFYEGAFKYLTKVFNISFCFLFNLEDNIISMLRTSRDIINIISRYYFELSNDKIKNDDELNFIGKYSILFNEIVDIVEEKKIINNGKGEEITLLEICSNIKKQIEQVNEKLKDNNVSCIALNNYKKLVEKFIQIIKINNLTVNQLNLTSLNYNYNDNIILDLQRLYKLAQIWENYNHALEQDYTDLFSKIINSEDFKELYFTTITSSYVRDFVKENKLTKLYGLFIKKYAKKIYKYILYIPLTRGIKAYVSNFFRISLNISSVDFIAITDNKSKEEILKSYLLIILIQESFHFLFRLNKEGESVTKVISPQSKKLKEYYNEIGVDIILYLFGAEYITFISKENSELLNNLESWRKEKTNFKVFQKAYLSCGTLIYEDMKNIDSGLKCNISVNENERIDWKVCSDAAVRFCF